MPLSSKYLNELGYEKLTHFWDRCLHRLKAKDRHGVHSPLAYSFNNYLHQQRKRTPKHFTASVHEVDLIKHIIAFFRPGQIAVANPFNRVQGRQTPLAELLNAPPAQTHSVSNNPPDYQFKSMLLVTPDINPQDWEQAITSFYSHSAKPFIIVVQQPYRSRQAKAAWFALQARENVDMSLDLFKVGMLIRSQAILGKQHLTLRA